MAMFPLRLFSGFTILALCTARQYIFVNENKTWTEAQSYCRDKYTDLVTIENEQETLQLLNTVYDYNSSDLAWIGLYDDLNSWKWTLEESDFFKEGEKLFRNWYKQESVNSGGQNLCVYVYRGIWATSNCHNTFGFVCYDGRTNASSSYVPVSQPMDWTEAQRYCRQHHTDLVIIRNETENQNIYSFTLNGPVWIGLYRTRSWSDQSNSTFSNWRSGEPNNAGNNEYCTAVAFSDSTWTDENCDYQIPFICYNVTSRQYHFISVNKSWSEAQTYCRQNYIDLATITNMTEMNSVMNTVNGSYNGLAWIGLYDDVNSWRWSLEDDGFYQEGERDFRKWNHQPDNNGGNEMCVYMNVNDGSWFDSSCDNMLPYVCYDGRENATQRYIKITNGNTWTEALRYCREHHTDLVNVRNQTENQMLTGSKGGMIWIGLYRNRIWSNHVISSYQNWKPGSTRMYERSVEFNSFQYCSAVSFDNLGQWTYENCFSIRPFVCYTTLASSRQYHFISVNKSWSEAQTYCRQNYIDLATITNMTEMNRLIKTVRGIYYGSVWIGQYDDVNSWRWSLGNTEFDGGFKSWYVQQQRNAYGQSLCVSMSYQGIWQEMLCSTMVSFICYDGRQNASVSYVYVKDIKTWTEAQSYCREHHTDLVSIRNETENEKVQSFSQYYGTIWIGLYRTRSWSDQSNSTFSNWRSGEPNNAGNNENCTAVAFSDAGEWTDQNCYYQLPFICHSGSSLASSRQYHFISVNKSWSEAQTYCRQNYIDLATITNMTEMNSVMNTVNGSYNGSAWIGLYDDVNSWRWSLEDDGFYQEGEREFRNWHHQPDNKGGNELCVYMNYEGSWFDSSCDNYFQFVCYDGRENASQKYVWEYQRKSWSEAQTHCRQFYTDLASVTNETERQQILRININIEITDGSDDDKVWIGLHRRKLWSDQSNSSFTYLVSWTYAEPDNGLSIPAQTGAQHCTAVSFKSFGYWTDESCFNRLPFFCYSEKYVSGLRVNFLGEYNLSQSQIEEFIDKLKQELIRQGVPGNFTMRLRNIGKSGQTRDYHKIITSS